VTLPRAVVAALCAIILGAQVRASLPISRVTYGWYWPFLSYPMYAIAHQRGDSLVARELRATTCGSPATTTILGADALGPPPAELDALLREIARNPGAPAPALTAKATRAIDAQFPGRFCEASVWARTLFVADPLTHRLRAPMQRVAAWTIAGVARP